jgi:hypothetical protein
MKRMTPGVTAVTLAVFSFVLTGCEAQAPPPLTPTSPTGVSGQTAPRSIAPRAPDRLEGQAAAAAHAHHGVTAVAGSRKVELKMTPEISQELADLRKFVAPFHNFDKAVEYGYSVPAPGPGVCISDPVRGGMGFHYTFSKADLINDGGTVNLLEPEFLVYAPKKNGGVKFSALDYFVPYTEWSEPQPPSLLGVPFAREDGFQAYVLHIWLFWHNPAGMFENYNPDVPLC